MLIIAQPRSASSSLVDTLGIIVGLPGKQIFSINGISYKSLYGTPVGYNFLPSAHSDFRDVPFEHINDLINQTMIIRKQHFPPTKTTINGLKRTKKPVLIQLRDPKESMLSYKKLGFENYQNSLHDLQLFNAEYSKLNGQENILIVQYCDLVSQFHTTIIKILNHFNFPIPSNIMDTKLSRKRVDESDYNDYLKGKRVAFIGPAPTLKNSGLGKKIDSYDVVIRMKQPIIPENLHKDYGSKTDVIYCNLNDVGYERPVHTYFKEWKGNGLKWLVMARRKKNRNDNIKSMGVTNYFRYKRVTKKFYRECKRKCNCVGRNIPFTGTVALLELLTMPCKELFIAGFNYYKNSNNGENGHYDGFNTKRFESGVDYKKYYNVIYQDGNLAYRHNANNDIDAVRSAVTGKRNVILYKDIKNALGL